MTIWVDAHLSPAIATWITTNFGITAYALRDLGLRDAEDPEIFQAAKSQGVIFITKDSDFVELVDRRRSTEIDLTSSHLIKLWVFIPPSGELIFT